MSAAMTGTGDTPILDINNLVVEYHSPGRPPFRASDVVDLNVAPGETVGLVGESGSGKSTIGRAVLGLTPVTSGSIHFEGRDISHASEKQRRALSADLQVIFQDPYGSLNPTRTIGQTLAEPLLVHRKLSRGEIARQIAEMLSKVGMAPNVASRYPGQFSGGQRQRIAIARALMLSPRLVICDEPVSALDLSVQAQVLNLLAALRKELSLSYLFIAHDLAVVRHLSQRIVVLYRGRVMEEGPARTVYTAPAHPYTQALLAAAPVPDPDLQRKRREAVTTRSIDQSAPPYDACPFSTRCPHVRTICLQGRPPLEQTGKGVRVACVRWREIEPPREVILDPSPHATATPLRAAAAYHPPTTPTGA